MNVDERLARNSGALRSSAIDAYNATYADTGRLRDSDSFYEWVLDKLDARHGRLLDIACGEGHLTHIARARGIDGWGVDYAAEALDTAQQIVGLPRFTLGDGQELPFADHSFDYATNLGSLEHFVAPEQGLAEMRRVLRPDGAAAIVLPNSYYLLDILWHVWRTGYPVSHKQTIERFATAGEWSSLLRTNGFEIVRIHKYNLMFPRTRADWRWYRRFPIKFAYPLLSPLTPFNLSYSFLFICRPTP